MPWYLNRWALLSSVIWIIGVAPSIAAQIIPDVTLPVGERSQVTGTPNVQIDGGARRGGNLFHSFSQFSIPTGGSAYFNNAVDVQNIFSRVTGGSISNIDGVIRANGTANLFLLNPNGILFGPNARLNIGGSFVASTANSINFADNFQYSAVNPQTPPLLTVSVPIGLQMGADPGAIVVQGTGYDLSVAVPVFSPLIRGSRSTGLQVPAGRTLALIGGDIELAGGTLTAEQGRIELGSVRDGQVSLSNGFALSYPGVPTLGDIRLSQQALVDASGGGFIQVQGNRVSLANGSLILIRNEGIQTGGSINVNAFQALEVSGISPDGRFSGGLVSQTAGSGKGADIIVSTRQAIARNGGQIFTSSFGSGNTGNITVNAADSISAVGSVQANGSLPVNPIFTSGIVIIPFSSGDGGTITVSTRQLSLLEGAAVSSPTFGTGQSGSVTVNATEAVELSGQSPLFSPSAISSNTFSLGNARDVTINTGRLIIRDGGTVSSATLGPGNAGSLTINATELIDVSGRVPNSPEITSLESSAPILSVELQQSFGASARPSGNSGNLTINTPRLRVSDGASVRVNNDGFGSAGTLQINVNSIVVDRGGTITAATASGEGGNLNLNVRDFLLLRNNSQVTTSAGGTGNGGNIRINASSIVAVPSENSDITANSVNARGGNITINASGIFGIQFRQQNTPLSNITATGANSALNGTVQLNINQLDPIAGLVSLPTDLVDSSRMIAQGCPANQGNSFVMSGRGGLPPTPEQQLDDDADWQDRRQLTVPERTRKRAKSQESEVRISSKLRTQNLELKTPPDTPLVEAIRWQITPDGEVFLIADTSDPTVQNPLNQPVTCRGSKESIIR